MFKKLVLISFVSFSFAACTKTSTTGGCGYTESTVTAPATEIAALQTWITANHPAAILHPSGFFYEIGTGGTAGIPNICSRIAIKYSGYLISPSPGFKFDENLTGTTLLMYQLIIGWQKGIPLLKAGGTINLYIPPTLAYGSAGSGAVPANAYLQFNIQLLDVQ